MSIPGLCAFSLEVAKGGCWNGQCKKIYYTGKYAIRRKKEEKTSQKYSTIFLKYSKMLYFNGNFLDVKFNKMGKDGTGGLAKFPYAHQNSRKEEKKHRIRSGEGKKMEGGVVENILNMSV